MQSKVWDKTYQLMSWWDSEAVKASRIMVVGSGALGNEVLKNLALMGVGHICIVDFDTIEYSNLSRSVLFRESDCGRRKADVAAERIQEINPNIGVTTFHGDIMLDVGLGVFRAMDVVIGCLDNRLARLHINRHCHKVNKIWIDGAIENLAGQLSVYQPGITCYECQLMEAEWKNIKYKLGCPDIARRNSSQGRIPTTPISSSIIGAMQVQEALKIVHKNYDQSSAGMKYYYEGMNNETLWFPARVPEKEDCLSHFLYGPILEEDQLHSEMTVGQFLSWAENKFGPADGYIEFDYEVILEITTKKSEESFSLICAQPHFSDEMIHTYQRIPGEDIVITHSTHKIDRNFPDQGKSLSALGVAPLHILRLIWGKEMYFIELSGDKKQYKFMPNRDK